MKRFIVFLPMTKDESSAIDTPVRCSGPKQLDRGLDFTRRSGSKATKPLSPYVAVMVARMTKTYLDFDSGKATTQQHNNKTKYR